METQTPTRDLDTAEEGEGGMIWESSTETYTLPYVKQIAGIFCMSQEIQSWCSGIT